jgi:hypothetical protein
MASHERGFESPIELRELEPSPVEDTPNELPSDGYFPPTKPVSRSTTFLGLGDHGPAYYRMSSCRIPWTVTVTVTDRLYNSNTTSTLLFVRVWRFHRLSCRKHIPGPARHTISSIFRFLPSTHKTILPIAAFRTITCCRATCSAHNIWACFASVPAATATTAIWRRGERSPAQGELASCQWDKRTGICDNMAGGRTCNC